MVVVVVVVFVSASTRGYMRDPHLLCMTASDGGNFDLIEVRTALLQLLHPPVKPLLALIHVLQTALHTLDFGLLATQLHLWTERGVAQK